MSQKPAPKWVRVDRRYRNPYRLTGHAVKRIALAVLCLIMISVVGATHGLILIPGGILAASGYAIHRRNRRMLYQPPPVYLPPDAPVGERRTRQPIPQHIKVTVAARDGGLCRCTAYPCHGHLGMCGSVQEPQFDHVIPWSAGGADTVANLILKCGPCNRRKGARYAG
jgi:hypothetical protein